MCQLLYIYKFINFTDSRGGSREGANYISGGGLGGAASEKL